MLDTLSVTRIAHSCMLIEIAGRRFLTDPWFTDTRSGRAGEPRGATAADLPRLDGILVSHAHGDHSELEALRGRDAPVVCHSTVRRKALAAGFADVRCPEPWASTEVSDVEVIAIPAKHKVPETGFVLRASDAAVYFAGDTLRIPELSEIPERLGRIDIAAVPTNGLRIVPLLGRKVVMDAEDAAELVGTIGARVAVPHHYAFSSGPLGDVLLTRKDTDPRHFRDAARRLAPHTRVEILPTGQRLEVPVAPAAAG